MKILMLVNWKVDYCEYTPEDIQAPDYCLKDERYWFYRYFQDNVQVDVIDIKSFDWLEKFEKYKLHFYVWQALKAIPKLRNYDLVVSHGMQSGVALSLWRRVFKTRTKHIVFDIGSFNSAAEKGIALKFMQFASKSIDGIVYHTSNQIEYYKRKFPWIVEKCKYIKFGTDWEFFCNLDVEERQDRNTYIVCVGYDSRDWDTLIRAHQLINTNVKLRLIGHISEKYKNIEGIEQIGPVSIKELNSHIYNAKFCVLPLFPYNFSYGQMTLLQQMVMGKCVIASKVPSLVDYIKDGETGILYEPLNVGDLANKLSLLINEDDICEQYGKNARNYILNCNNEQTMSEEIESFLKGIMNKVDR